MEAMKAQYGKAEANVEKIARELEQHQVVLMKDIAMFDHVVILQHPGLGAHLDGHHPRQLQIVELLLKPVAHLHHVVIRGAQKRREAEVELGRIEGELKQKLMELRN